MAAITGDRITRTKMPLFGQADLRAFHSAAERIKVGRAVAANGLGRSLTHEEVQAIVVAELVTEVIQEDALGELNLFRSPNVPAAHQPKLRPAGGCSRLTTG